MQHMNIYSLNCYRSILKSVVEERKAVDPEDNFQRLAEQMRIPKSYMSKVLHAKADLSADQLHLACTHLQLGDDETDFLQLLLERERSGLAARKKRLDVLIARTQRQYVTASEYLNAPSANDQISGRAEYFLDSWGAIVHMALLIPRFREDLVLLARELGLSPARLNETMSMLERLKFIERKQKTVKVLVEHLHLPSVSSVYRAWRNSLRSLGAAKTDSLSDTENYTFAAVFTCDQKTEQTIRVRILEMLKEVEDQVDKAKIADVYQIEISLFPWTKISSSKA